MSASNENLSLTPDSDNDNFEAADNQNQDGLPTILPEGQTAKMRSWFQNLWRSSAAEDATTSETGNTGEDQALAGTEHCDEANTTEESLSSSWFQTLWKSRDNKEIDGATTDVNPSAQLPQPTVRQRISGVFRRNGSQELQPRIPSGETVPDVEQKEMISEIAEDRSKLAVAFAKAINSISATKDRREVVDWFVAAYDVLATEPQTRQKIAKLYGLVDSKRVAKLIANTAITASKSYSGSNLPLSIKLALPVTTLGACMFGAQGAGIVAFGGGIGLPVVLLLFLGSAGVASIIEALIKDKRNIEPTTRLLLSLIQLETSRRMTKELAAELKTDLEPARRCEILGDDARVLCELRNMDPFDFERHVMSFFEGCKLTAGVTRKSKDKGFDGWADHPQGLLIVQCKRFRENNSVGRPDLQQFKGVIEEQNAYHGFFVTTSSFSKDALESAILSEKVTLIEHVSLLAWHKQGKADLTHLANCK